MKTNILPVLVLVFLFWGCSNDDASTDIEEDSSVPDFIAIGEDLENVYLYSYLASEDREQVVNLTTEKSVDRFFITLRQNSEVLTFYSFEGGSFSARQFNMQNGETRLLENIYNASVERSIIWGTNSPEKLFFGYYSPQGTSNYGMRSVDIASDAIIDISLEANVQTVYEPLYANGKLFMTFRASSGDYRTAVIRAETLEILEVWEFGSATPSIFIDEAGNVALITNTGGVDFTQSIYDFDTLEKLGETQFSINHTFPPGPVEAELIGDKLYYLNFYAQPSVAQFGPAIYDFRNKENNIIDMIGIVEALEQEEDAVVTITAYRYLPAGRAFMFGYTRNFSNGNFLGGVMVISREGELIRKFQTPFIPVYFIEN
jgi:hypothetical protein